MIKTELIQSYVVLAARLALCKITNVITVVVSIIRLLILVSKLSTESVGNRRELVANSVHTADADTTLIRVGDVIIRTRSVLGLRAFPAVTIVLPPSGGIAIRRVVGVCVRVFVNVCWGRISRKTFGLEIEACWSELRSLL